MDKNFIASLKSSENESSQKGMFFKGDFELSKTGDTYFDMRKYTKGVVYINGHNLGRYWNVGPQQRLYCPASWLKAGKNEILVFDMVQEKVAEVQGMPSL